jgi:hypothetical protein
MRSAELRSFAAKNSLTVENDREKFSGPLHRCAEMLRPRLHPVIASDCCKEIGPFFV